MKRLHLLLTVKDSAANIPKNLEARRRLEFFTNSLFMDMPQAKPVCEMMPFWYFLLVIVIVIVSIIIYHHYCIIFCFLFSVDDFQVLLNNSL